jgi:protein-tyrosine-phosphatase/DNA-binding transcriptional ArsR family regulator
LVYRAGVSGVPGDLHPIEFLQLIGDPLRWQLQCELARSDRRVGELCELVGKPQSLVSYHLRELRTAGLVSARQSAADGRDTYYRARVGRCAELLHAAGAALHPAVRLEPADTVPKTARGHRPKVLFLCTGNSARSQIAEALTEERSRGAVVARSAGSRPKPLHPNAVRVMAERSIDISGRRTKRLDRFARTRFDMVITLCDKVREVCPEFPGPPVTAHWSMADPAADGDDETSYPAFLRTADEIDERVGLLVAQLGTELRNEKEAV